MKNLFKKFFSDESGQGMTEYALILALVSIVAIGALHLLGVEIGTIFGSIKDTLVSPPA